MSSPSPAPLIPTLPDDLVEWDQWVLWRLETRDGKPTKVPYQVDGSRAKSDDPATWSSFEAVCTAWQKAAARYQGIGFVFGEQDPFAGIDLDDCLDAQGELKAWAGRIIERFADTYMEVSPSGHGIKIWSRARLDGRGRRAVYHDGAIEIYDRGRFFTATGRLFHDAVLEVADHQEDVARLYGFLAGGTAGQKSAGPKANLHEQKVWTSGERYHKLQSAAGQYRAVGMDRDEIYLALVALNQSRCQPPKEDSVLVELANWAGTLELGRWRVIQMPPPPGHPAAASDIPLPPAPEANEGVIASTGTVPQALHPQVAPAKEEAKVPCVDFDSGSVPPPSPEVGGGSGGPNLLPFPFTDTGNAERLVALYGRDIRYCVEMKKWMVWDGKRWAVDAIGSVKQLATKMARTLYVQAADVADDNLRKATEKWARASESAGGISRTLDCAEHQDGIPISTAQLDTHAMLLNCVNGVIDLEKGTLRPHDRSLYLTKLCHVRFNAKAVAPRFNAFLRRIMGENPDAEPTETTARLVSYLQRAFGYALTGDVSAKVVFCFFGKGNNGKTTLLETFRHILSEFSCQINIDTLMQKPGGESNATLADLADLRGARFVTTSEADEGQKLKVGKLKYLSAGMGSIKTMRKYENAIEFPATHKLFLDANHKPVLPANDDATWNRVRPVPFTVTIPQEEIDLTLLDKLKAEAEGILAWAVRGCVMWQRDGLGNPDEVRDAGAAWRTQSDTLADFLADCCVLHQDMFCKSSDLWKRYENWAEENGEKYLLSRVKFGERLEASGCRASRRRFAGVAVRSWEGIGIKTEFSDE